MRDALLFYGLAALIVLLLARFIPRKKSVTDEKRSATQIHKLSVKGPINSKKLLDERVRQLLDVEGGKIYAVQLVHRNTSLGLLESKTYVETLEKGETPTTPLQFKP